MKILNLYAGIGGNRKLWGDEHEITAVEHNQKIADVYSRFFPADTMVVGDAHEYLLKHYHEFDFIWSSPPCPTHTKMNIANQLSPYKDNSAQLKQGGGITPRYPSMTLYQEIIFLKHFFQGKWCVENVIAYYDPLIPPVEFGKHWFWTNFLFSTAIPTQGRAMGKNDTAKSIAVRKGYDWDELEGVDRELVLRNCVEPEVGVHILKAVEKNTSLFSMEIPAEKKQKSLL
jgi:DNA (cytosine-5)-methyltransferase 1